VMEGRRGGRSRRRAGRSTGAISGRGRRCPSWRRWTRRVITGGASVWRSPQLTYVHAGTAGRDGRVEISSFETWDACWWPIAITCSASRMSSPS
jgi:hypothetical protein